MPHDRIPLAFRQSLGQTSNPALHPQPNLKKAFVELFGLSSLPVRALNNHLRSGFLTQQAGRLRLFIDTNLYKNVALYDIAHVMALLKLDDGDQTIQQINIEFNGVYSKASSLLQHVSIMIAVLSIIYTSSTGSLKLFIVLNIAFYLLSLLLILRVIWVPEFLEDQIEQRKVILTKELLFSRKYMRSAHLIVTVLTPLIVTIFIISAWQATGDKIASFPITPK